MWVIPRRVIPIPDLSRDCDAPWMSRRQAGRVSPSLALSPGGHDSVMFEVALSPSCATYVTRPAPPSSIRPPSLHPSVASTFQRERE